MATKEIIKFAVLPEVLPRFKGLMGSGFGHIAWFMAMVYAAVRILPEGHPCLRPENAGRFGVAYVMVEAARHLKFSVRNIDQILIFFTLLAGIVMLLFQAFLFVLSLFILPAMAMPTTPVGFFVTPRPEQDIALILLDLVYGIPDFFHSCISEGIDCEDTKGRPLPVAVTGNFPTPFQMALHAMLQFYSFGIFLVGVVVIIYYGITIVAETAQSGTPFGRRFNGLWAPIRLIFFFFLIAPVYYDGLSMAQLAGLYAAKFGSGLGTNGWVLFNKTLSGAGNWSLLGRPETMLARPDTPEIGSLLQFMSTVATCKYAERLVHGRYIQPYLVSDIPSQAGNIVSNAVLVRKWPANDRPTALAPEAPGAPNGIDFRRALQFYQNGDIRIRFGEYSPALYPNQSGNVYPWCGEIIIPNPGIALGVDANGNYVNYMVQGNKNIAMIHMFDSWFFIFVRLLWSDETAGAPNRIHEWGSNIAYNVIEGETRPEPTANDMLAMSAEYKWYLNNAIKAAIEMQAQYNTYAVPDELLRKGWAGAAIWYNAVAEANGGFAASVQTSPRPKLWPDALEQILTAQRKNNKEVSGPDRFDPALANGKIVEFKRDGEDRIAEAENRMFTLWQESNVVQTSFNVDAAGSAAAARALSPGQTAQTTNNIILDSINAIFGTSGLFDLRKNPEINPLAQIAGTGKLLINHAIIAFGFAAGASIAGGLGGMLAQWVGAMGNAASEMAVTIGTIGLTVGFLMYYVIPFLPFVYFFFAVGGWIKALFEAMVGLPLWALAHLRIDGNGLPGQAAMNGYFLIFEIFLRPLLIIFSFVGAIAILSAQVMVLNDIFDLVTLNLTGFDPDVQNPGPTDLAYYRQAIDELFFTVIYAILVYMMALASFKMVDLIPSQILRWLGAGVSSSTEQEKDAAGQLMSMTSGGIVAAGSKFGQAGGLARATMFSYVNKK